MPRLPRRTGLWAFVLSALLPLWVCGARRATPQQMTETRRAHLAMLDNPVANYADIPAYFMQGNPDECAKLRVRFEAELAKSASDRERAVLHFLVAEAVANEILFRPLLRVASSTPKGVLAGGRRTVATHYLAAFGLASGNGGDPVFLRHVSDAFLRRIASGVASDPADSKLDGRIIAEYIDVVEDRADLVFPPTLVPPAYRRLGIARRLWSRLPETPPSDGAELARCLRLAVACECQPKAVLYADAVWQRCAAGPKVGGEPAVVLAARVVCQTPGRERDGWQRLRHIAPSVIDAWLDLYRYSPKGAPGLSNAERLAFVDRYLEASTTCTRSEHPYLKYYGNAVRMLMEEGAFADALLYLDRAIEERNVPVQREFAAIVLSKGDCLVRLGRAGEAREAYELAKRAANGTLPRVATLATDRLAALDARKEEE